MILQNTAPVDIVLFEGWMLGFEPLILDAQTLGQIPSSSSSAMNPLSKDMQVCMFINILY